jgi:hypothetical protein
MTNQVRMTNVPQPQPEFWFRARALIGHWALVIGHLAPAIRAATVRERFLGSDRYSGSENAVGNAHPVSWKTFAAIVICSRLRR